MGLEPDGCWFASSEQHGKTHLVERQRVMEEQVSSNQSDAEFKMTKHVVSVY